MFRVISHVYLHSSRRNVSTLQRLDGRSLLRVCGPETRDFLQGLITNDINHLDNSDCMYTMFLNPKGRVLYDSLLYKVKEENTFLVDCDKYVINLLEKHLKVYKMRKKVDITLNDDLDVWTLFESDFEKKDLKLSSNENIKVFCDPRVSKLGFRLLAHKSLDSIRNDLCLNNAVVNKKTDDYRMLRYKLGISEGAKDLPPGLSLPLEANCDYLHGVSFHKGCYIGQELTARTYHTGVIRRRIMPLFFENAVRELPFDTAVYSSENLKKTIGKLKGAIGNYGIAQLKIEEALEAPHLIVDGLKASTIRPSWWPVEAPKEKITLSRK